LKHLRTRWKQTLVSVLSVAVGVMILTTALSLTNGFESDMVEKILGTTPHISVKPSLEDYLPKYQTLQKQLQRYPDVIEVYPLQKQQALIRNPVHTTGTLVYGVRPQDAQKSLKSYLSKGQWQIPGKASLVVGSELAKKLQLFRGDTVELVTALGTSVFTISGVFHSGLYELDVRLVLMPLDQIQALYQTGDVVNEIAIKVKNVFGVQAVASQIQKGFPVLYLRTWMDSNKSLLRAMALEKKVIFLVILFIIVVAMIGIANTLVMIVMEKTMDIGIMRALGASRRQVGLIFLAQGFVIGVVGVLTGSLLGSLTSLYLTFFPVRIPGDVYDLDHLPVQMQAQDFIVVALATLVICILASFFPARRALRADPIEILRRNS
jgi:lipoprotein-releasing system permease protein